MRTATIVAPKWFDSLRWLLLGIAATLIVWAVYYTGDSTAVEQGDSIGFTLCVLSWSVIAFSVHRLAYTGGFDCTSSSVWLDGLPVAMAVWVFFSGLVNSGWLTGTPPAIGGDLRSAMNEGWWWLTSAGYFVMIRRILALPKASLAVLGLLIACAIILAVHTLHQHLISLPQTARDFFADPDGQLTQLGIDAPEGSAARMIFENRLRDGGPTATFALANSLAGPLAMIGAACLTILFELRKSLRSQRALVALISIALVAILAALATTGSRSGVLSVAVAGLYLVCRFIAGGRRKFGRKVLLTIGSAAILLIGFVFLAGDQNSWAQAPATIQLRLQYWSSTLAMVRDHPWFGIGPGNFQLAHQAYRDSRAHELIAEPHNFWIETLACGGFVAALLLSAWLLVIARNSGGRRGPEDMSLNNEKALSFLPAMLAVSVGGFLGLFLVWYLGLVWGMVPDFEAHQFAIPLAIVFLVGWFRFADNASEHLPCRTIGLIAFATGLVHLCFTGGWTIPGVTLILLTLLGMAVQIRRELETSNRVHFRWSWCGDWIAGGALIATLWLTSVRPVAATREAINQAEIALSRNRLATARKTLQSSIAEDSLAVDPAIWLASIENRGLVQSLIRSPKTRIAEANDNIFAEAVRRIGNDPSKLLVIAELHLHRYQAGGRGEDLAAAAETLTRMIKLSPTHQGFVAQAAEIAREQARIGQSSIGNPVNLAERARTLSEAGGVVTRMLNRQLILIASPLGRLAAKGPVRKPASEVLQPLLPNANRNQPDDR